MNALIRGQWAQVRQPRKRVSEHRHVVSVGDALARFIVRGDALEQRIKTEAAPVPEAEYEWWNRAGYAFLLATFGFATATDFGTRREPSRKAAGYYTQEVLDQLNRVMAQPEVLQKISDPQRTPRDVLKHRRSTSSANPRVMLRGVGARLFTTGQMAR